MFINYFIIIIIFVLEHTLSIFVELFDTLSANLLYIIYIVRV